MRHDARFTPGPAARPRTLAIVDPGTHKTVVMLLVADASAPAGWRIAGVGHQFSRGIKARVVVQTDEAVQALRAALTQAERMAGIAADRALVTYGCSRLREHVFAMPGRDGSDADCAAAGQAAVQQDGFLPLFTDVSQAADGGRVARVQAADEGPVKALIHVVERADVEVAGVLPSALAAGLAVTTADERAAGVTVFDLGAGASTAAFFEGGRYAGSIAVPVGGDTMTYDIAREFEVPVVEAERIKLACGTLTRAQSFLHGALGRAVRPSQDDGDRDHEGADIRHHRAETLVSDRAQSLAGLLADRVMAASAGRRVLGSVVLTGGVSQLEMLADRLTALFGVEALVRRPRDVGGMFVDSLMTPAFATAIGAGHALAGASGGWWYEPSGRFGGEMQRRQVHVPAGRVAGRTAVRDHV